MKYFILIAPLILLPFGIHAEATNAIKELEKNGGIISPTIDGGLRVEFQLSGRDLKDEGLEPIKLLESVKVLNLRDTKITNAGIINIKGMKDLKRLHLERTNVDDGCIDYLTGLQELEYLNLYSTKVSDLGLSKLKDLKNLKKLYLWQTNVTNEGVKQLETALPDLKIVQGVDLDKIIPVKKPPPRPTEDLKWIPSTGEIPPRSISGDNTTIIFHNQMKRKVKIYWVEYNGKLKLYGEIAPGGTREQNTFSTASWLVTDMEDTYLGYFRTSSKVGKALIPKI
ncbi:MAG: hypothetical protein CMP45_04755 [Rickettsiales bacterium]|nr:hypothetical protein [Verrucomicrobiaceae bacterium]MBV63797.1 hypothetical protein [Rickettsiales bacterium]|tara:strand:+ start:1538 stop:2383 length:846 start_codon:yes stop_codon:yes gene_type:complete